MPSVVHSYTFGAHNLVAITFCLQSESYVNQAIQMALQPANIYHSMVTVFLMMEKGQLKDQQEREIKLANAAKALSGHFSAKLSHFKA